MSQTGNRHQMEDRGLIDLKLEVDERFESEEMMYSGVVRRDFKKFRVYNAEIRKDTFQTMLSGFIKESAQRTSTGFIVDFKPMTAEPVAPPRKVSDA